LSPTGCETITLRKCARHARRMNAGESAPIVP
jgi:hypothetical protein